MRNPFQVCLAGKNPLRLILDRASTARHSNIRLVEFSDVASVAITAAATSVITSPFVRHVMHRRGVLDQPNERSSHRVPIPRGGGWAILAGTAAGLALGAVRGWRLPPSNLVVVAALAAVGFVDDTVQLPAGPRLAAQVASGLGLDILSSSFPVTTGAIPWLVNVVNFMDGINGISALTTIVWSWSAARWGVENGNGEIALLAAAIGGSAAGFLPYNVRRKRMFLGDVGSYAIGATMAIAISWPTLTIRDRIALASPLTIYFADTGFTLLRRFLRRENILAAHREHVYQQLAVDRRWGHVPTAIWAAGAALAISTAARKNQFGMILIIAIFYMATPSLAEAIHANEDDGH